MSGIVGNERRNEQTWADLQVDLGSIYYKRRTLERLRDGKNRLGAVTYRAAFVENAVSEDLRRRVKPSSVNSIASQITLRILGIGSISSGHPSFCRLKQLLPGAVL